MHNWELAMYSYSDGNVFAYVESQKSQDKCLKTAKLSWKRERERGRELCSWNLYFEIDQNYSLLIETMNIELVRY